MMATLPKEHNQRVTLSPPSSPPPLGLRERKKAKTRAAIQQHALRLFGEQGYDATTIDQIAEAAEVSPATVFRYYPTKEDLVLQDDLDPPFIRAFNAQPPELGPIPAMRQAFRQVFGRLTPEQLDEQFERFALIRSVPDLRAKMLEEFTRQVQGIAEIVATRVGRKPDDIALLTFSGALVGAVLAAFLAVEDKPRADYFKAFDEALAFLEAGLPL